MSSALIKTTSGLPADRHNFCHFLIADPQMDATAAYLKVKPGVKTNTASRNSTRWLAEPKVKAYLAELMNAREKRLEMDEDWVMTRLRDIHDRCVQAEPVYDPSRPKFDDEGNPADPLYYKFDSSGALKSLELIGKHLRMFSDKTDTAQMTVSMDINLDSKKVIEGTYRKTG